MSLQSLKIHFKWVGECPPLLVKLSFVSLPLLYSPVVWKYIVKMNKVYLKKKSMKKNGLPFARIAAPAVVKRKKFTALTCSARWGGTWGRLCGTDSGSQRREKPTGCSIWSAWVSETRPTLRWRVCGLLKAAPGCTWRPTRRSWRWGRRRWWVVHQTQHTFSQTASRHSAREPNRVKFNETEVGSERSTPHV